MAVWNPFDTEGGQNWVRAEKQAIEELGDDQRNALEQYDALRLSETNAAVALGQDRNVASENARETAITRIPEGLEASRTVAKRMDEIIEGNQ